MPLPIPESVRDLPARVPKRAFRAHPAIAAGLWGGVVGAAASMAGRGSLIFGALAGGAVAYMLGTRAQVGPVGQPIIVLDAETRLEAMRGVAPNFDPDSYARAAWAMQHPGWPSPHDVVIDA